MPAMSQEDPEPQARVPPVVAGSKAGPLLTAGERRLLLKGKGRGAYHSETFGRSFGRMGAAMGEAASLVRRAGWREAADNLANPVLVKALRQQLRSRIFPIAFALLQLGLLMYALALLTGDMGAGNRDEHEAIFWSVTVGLLLLLLPVRAMMSLRGEVEPGRFDLIILSGRGGRDLVFGSWLAQIMGGGILLCSALPFAMLRYLIAGGELFATVGWLASLFGYSCILVGLGVLWSSIQNRAGRIVMIVVGVLLGPFCMSLVVGAMVALSTAVGAGAWAALFGNSLLIGLGLLLVVAFLRGRGRDLEQTWRFRNRLNNP